MSIGNSVATTLIAIVIGVGFLIILTFLAVCALPVVLDFSNPILPLCTYEFEGQTHSPGVCDDEGIYFRGLENVFWWLAGSLVTYFLSVCISGFISGFYLNCTNLYQKTQYWQALISGLAIGMIGPILFAIISPSDSQYAIIGAITVGLIAALVALFGYYVSGRRTMRSLAG